MDLKIIVNGNHEFNYTATEFRYRPGADKNAYQIYGLFGRGSSRLKEFIDYLKTFDEGTIKNIRIEEDNFDVVFNCVDWKYQASFKSGNAYRVEFLYFVVE